jgi:hypothetical protein
VNDNWKVFGRKQQWPNLRYYPGIFLEELSKTIKNFSQDSWSLWAEIRGV